MKIESQDITLLNQSYITDSKSNHINSTQIEPLVSMENYKYCPPSAPSPGLVLFNNEEESDIVFIVSQDLNSNKEKWRFPSHSFIIKDSSPIFQTILQQLHEKGMYSTDANNKPIINIQCRPEIFQMLMSFIYKKEVNLCSISACIGLLELSIKFMLKNLTHICLKFLHKNVSEENILEVISALHHIQQKKESLIVNHSSYCQEEYFENEFNCDNILNELFIKCYQILDSNAELVLKSEAILNLDQSTLIEILSRDTLQLSSELIAFECIQCWAIFQCQKQNKALVSKNKIDLLGKALYCVRYLTMTMEDFTCGPYASDLLSHEEKDAIFAKFKNKNFELPFHLKLLKIEEPRKVIVNNSVENSKTYLLETKSFKHKKGDKSKVRLVVAKRRNSPLKKLRKGLGDVMICIIQLLD